MPRRPRPQSRKPPTHDQQRSANNVVASKSKPVSRPTARREAEESTSEEEEEFEEGASGSGSASAEEEYEDELDADADAPRIAQWEDDEELDAAEQSESDAEDAEDSVRPADLVSFTMQNVTLPADHNVDSFTTRYVDSLTHSLVLLMFCRRSVLVTFRHTS